MVAVVGLCRRRSRFTAERDVLVGAVRERLDESLRDLASGGDHRFALSVDTVRCASRKLRRVVDVYCSQVARARPLFVGLVGDQVGYIPDGAHARWVTDQAGCQPDQRVSGVGCRRRLNP